MASRYRIAGVALALVVSLPGVASAATDPYGADSLGLVAYGDQVRAYTTGLDSWEVWICDTPNGTLDLDPQTVATFLNTELDPYFMWMSDGWYLPTFSVGGTVTGDSKWPNDPFDTHDECRFKVAAASSGTSAAALIVVDVAYQGGLATPGLSCEVASDCPTTYPQNHRWAVVGGATVTSVGGRPPALRTVAHEIGHTIHFPHSFGGNVTFLGGTTVYEYDNAMDVMSGGDSSLLNVGTLGIDRYAAGWVAQSKVRFHRGGTLIYQISPQGFGGTSELLVLPTDGPLGVYDVLGARVRSSFDGGLPYEGIEVYHIDQTGTACAFPTNGTCWGIQRRTSQIPVPNEPFTGGHVHGVGSTFQVRGVTVQVLSYDGAAFTIAVSGDSVAERFIDDNGNLHEPAIKAIASIGVTTGCNPTTDRYCPGKGVSRAEMAAFLLRAIGDTTQPSSTGTFSDVPPGQWYTAYVERLAELGISVGYGDGTFRPNASVTRAEMAVFLTRAFASLGAVQPSGAFADVSVDAWYAGAAEGILAGGVTTGCATEPLRYCPDAIVARDAMASFLSRALGLTS